MKKNLCVVQEQKIKQFYEMKIPNAGPQQKTQRKV